MKTPTFRQDMFHPNRIMYALIFALLFSGIGYYAPAFYLENIDKTEYYTMQQPLKMDKITYKPCDTTVLTTTRKSLVDTNITFTRDLKLIRIIDEAHVTIPQARFISDQIVSKGIKVISVALPLPCDLEDGTYYWEGNGIYKVRNIEKNYIYISDSFEVKRETVEEKIDELLEAH